MNLDATYRVSQNNETGFLLNISATNPENWDPYTNFEYKPIYVQFLGADIFDANLMKVNAT